jgi:tRNA nucleotidyltransferase (CCA-adding enzyme)
MKPGYHGIQSESYSIDNKTRRSSKALEVMATGRTPGHRMRTIEEIRRIIRSTMGALKERYGIHSPELFGSYVRGEQRKGSDIDILVAFDQERLSVSPVPSHSNRN